MKQQKFRRYKGRVFYRSHRRWPWVLLCLVLVAALLASVFAMLPSSDSESAAPSSETTSSSTTSTTGTSSSVTTTTTTTTTAATTVTTTTTVPQTDVGKSIAALARTLVDKPYVSMGNGPDEFDNYGLVHYCLTQHNIAEATRYIGRLAERGTAVEHGEWQEGDVVFFSNTKGTTPDYMGIYIGNGQFVAANKPGKNSCIYNINGPYFSARYLLARRFG